MGNIAKFTLAISKGLDRFNSIPPAAIQVRSDPIRLPTGRPVNAPRDAPVLFNRASMGDQTCDLTTASANFL